MRRPNHYLRNLGAKTLMRDLGRVLEIELPYCDRLAKMIPETPGMTLEKALRKPRIQSRYRQRSRCSPHHEARPPPRRPPRHAGMHAAGVVIGEKPLIEIIPLTREPKENLTVVQFERSHRSHWLAKNGLPRSQKPNRYLRSLRAHKRNHGSTSIPKASSR